jgi:hypothetical protein
VRTSTLTVQSAQFAESPILPKAADVKPTAKFDLHFGLHGWVDLAESQGRLNGFGFHVDLHCKGGGGDLAFP